MPKCTQKAVFYKIPTYGCSGPETHGGKFEDRRYDTEVIYSSSGQHFDSRDEKIRQAVKGEVCRRVRVK